MSQRFQRLFRLLDHLADGHSNIQRLAVELKIGERQVYRDIRELRSVGFHIEINPRTGNYEVYDPVLLPRRRRELCR